MGQVSNHLSPDSSPTRLTHASVKKVNNLPVVIALGVIVIFVLLIAMVAIKKSNAHPGPAPTTLRSAHKRDTYKLAQDVINHTYPVKTAKKIVLPPPPPPNHPMPLESLKPLALNPPSVTSHLSDSEIERLRQDKTQAFEEAVKTKITVSVDKTLIKQSSKSEDQYSVQMNGASAALSFKEQLQMMQKSIQKNQTVSSIGGKENEQRWHLNSTLQSPTTPFELRAGAVIPGVLISGIRSELHGQIIGQVSQDVFDTATGNHLLIPQGTKLVGVYSSDVKFGQDSVLVAWQRLVFPDGKAMDIGAMSGSDSAGFAGFRDKVDHHYARIYGSAILMSGIIAGISYSQNRNQSGLSGFQAPSVGDVLSQSLGQQIGQTTSELIAKNINTAPTINIRPGYEFNVTVTKDLVFAKPYRQFAY